MSENPRVSLQSRLREASTVPRPECPPRELLHRLAFRELEGERRTRLQEHLKRCPECAAEHDMALLFESDLVDDLDASEVAEIVARVEREAPVRSGDRRRSRGRRGAALGRARRKFGWRGALPAWQLAAAAGLAVALAIAAWPRPPALPSAHETTVRGSSVRAIAPQGDIAVAPAQLVWDVHPDAATYRVRLSSVDDTVLWEQVVDDNEIDVPTAVGASLLPLVRYVWTVEAVDATGALVAASEPQNFRVLPVDHPAPQPR